MEVLSEGQVLEVTAERLAFGGHAIARHADGIVVFVPFAAPGDRLRVEVTACEKSFVRARIVEVLAPGPSRTAPRCRHFGDCGGCQFQHVDYAEQVAQKGEFVRDALVRVGKFDWPAPVQVHHAEPWGYRSRTQLKLHATSGLRRDGKHGRLRKKERDRRPPPTVQPNGTPVLGFHRGFEHSVVDIEECPVLAPPLEAGMRDVRAALATMSPTELPYQIEGACGEGGASWAPDLPGMKKDL
ncbi:MAG: TRAM domain-containing protein, partial [Planctomycetes bacterium]|nr:TRAM domain-containing protein [Planctomycetota bacterium]